MAAIVAADEQSRNEQDKWRDDAALRADDSAGEPPRAGQSGVHKIVIRHDSAVGNSEDAGLAPVVSSVKADRAPETSRCAQKEAEEQSEEYNRGRADYILI